MPVGAQLTIHDGDDVAPGDTIAKISREVYKTRDITGGLPRVAELFEARRPKDPAVITEIDGEVRFGDIKRGKREVLVTPRRVRRMSGAIWFRSSNTCECTKVTACVRVTDSRKDRSIRTTF